MTENPNTVLKLSTDRPAFHFDYDLSKQTTHVAVRIAGTHLAKSGELAVGFTPSRDNIALAPGSWSRSVKLEQCKTLNLLFVKLAKVPEEQWLQQDPTP